MKFEPAELEQIADLVTERVIAALGDRLDSLAGSSSDKSMCTEREAAEQLGVSPFTLRTFRLEGRISASTSRRPILYDRAAVARAKKYLEER